MCAWQQRLECVAQAKTKILLTEMGERKTRRMASNSVLLPPPQPAPSAVMLGWPRPPTPASGSPVFELACYLENELTKDKVRASKYLEALFYMSTDGINNPWGREFDTSCIFYTTGPRGYGWPARGGKIGFWQAKLSPLTVGVLYRPHYSQLFPPTNKSLAKDIKTMRRDHFTPIRVAIFKTQKKTENNKS